MLRRLYTRVVDTLSATGPEESQESRDAALRLATATLLVDVARADQDFDETEFDALVRLIGREFDLDADDAAVLVNEATERADELVSVHELAQLLHRHLGDGEKARVVELLWRVAYADGRLDKYEDSLVLKISDLLYVPRGRVMRLKHDAVSRP